MSHPIIALRNVTRQPANAPQPIVQQLDFALHANEILVLLGASGSGKTTTLRLIAGLDTPDAGEIDIRGVCVSKAGYAHPPEQRRVGMVFQDYALFPHMTVAENVRFALHAYPKAQQQARIAAVLAQVGLSAYTERYPHQLSGGQQQRVAIARALAPEPSVMLFDEPFSNLDATIREQVRGELRALLRATNMSAIIVTHDQAEALAIADRIALLHEGRLHQIATPEELFARPRSPFAAQFMGQANVLDVTRHGDELYSEIGMLMVSDAHEHAVPSRHRQRILARYDDISFCEDDTHYNAHVSERRYEGITYHYTLTLRSGAVLHCRLPHEQGYALGSKVRVFFTTTHALVYFCDDAAVGQAIPNVAATPTP